MAKPDYLLAIDQGTTSTRCMIFTHAGVPVGAHQLEHEQIYPQPGWVEHEASAILGALDEALEEIGATYP